MKIAYYLPSLQAPGGIERIVTFKANYFAEHFEGYDITIITSEQMGKAPHFPLSPKVKHIIFPNSLWRYRMPAKTIAASSS